MDASRFGNVEARVHALQGRAASQGLAMVPQSFGIQASILTPRLDLFQASSGEGEEYYGGHYT